MSREHSVVGGGALDWWSRKDLLEAVMFESKSTHGDGKARSTHVSGDLVTGKSAEYLQKQKQEGWCNWRKRMASQEMRLGREAGRSQAELL